MAHLTDVPIRPRGLAAFQTVLAPEVWERVEGAMAEGREAFAGRVLWNVNSTARGGGVAEMLLPLLAYARGDGVDARWTVIRGDAPFFAITKRIHNRLHGSAGDGGPLGPAERAAYDRALRPNAEIYNGIAGFFPVRFDRPIAPVGAVDVRVAAVSNPDQIIAA